MPEPKRPRGRPRVAEPKPRDKARQLGRLNDDSWQQIRDAAAAAKKPLNEWMISVLFAEIRRMTRKGMM
jgi:predicted HicB family RNase H-like nuclease